MKKFGLIIFLVLGILLTGSGFLWAQEDVPGSGDHKLFTRMPGYYLAEYEENEFDSYDFYVGTGNPVKVEGHKFVIIYRIKEGEKASGSVQIIRNYTAAIKKIGGEVPEEGSYQAFMKLKKGSAEIWSAVYADSDGERYKLVIVEKAGLVQEVVANAAVLAQDIRNTGHVAIYGIYFDTGKSEIKPESELTLKEISRLLEQNQKLKLSVVGHTDNVGNLAYNMKLSEDRASAVVAGLVSQYGIDSGRLLARGVGPLCPVASNKKEEGRQQNRRVELVEM